MTTPGARALPTAAVGSLSTDDYGWIMGVDLWRAWPLPRGSRRRPEGYQRLATGVARSRGGGSR